MVWFGEVRSGKVW